MRERTRVKIRLLKAHFVDFSKKVDKHQIFLMASSLAYTTALALAPFVIIVLSFFSLLPSELKDKIYLELISSMGEEIGMVVKLIAKNAGQQIHFSKISGMLGFLVLLISSSAIFSQLRIALNKINERKQVRDEQGILFFFRDKIFSIGLVVGFAFLATVSLLVTTILTAVFPQNTEFVVHALSTGINFIFFTILFSAIYRFVPTDKLRWRKCFVAGAVSTTFYLIGKSYIEYYLEKTAIASFYGAAGSLIIFLAWVYYISLTILGSYELTVGLFLKSRDFSNR